MQHSSDKNHEFHFKLNKKIKDRLRKLAGDRKLSSFIVEILEKMQPFLEKLHFQGEEQESGYALVADAESVHVYMPGSLYRQLKLIHQDLNLYSIAQIVRLGIGFYLELLNDWGRNSLNNFLKHCQKSWENIKSTFRKKKESIRQWWDKSNTKIEIHTYYDSSYSPKAIFLH